MQRAELKLALPFAFPSFDSYSITQGSCSLKLLISPTKLELLKAMKICDILNPSFQSLADDICYTFDKGQFVVIFSLTDYQQLYHAGLPRRTQHIL